MRAYDRIGTFSETFGGWKMGVNGGKMGGKWSKSRKNGQNGHHTGNFEAFKLAVGISIAVRDQLCVKNKVTTLPWDVTGCKIEKYTRKQPKTAKKGENFANFVNGKVNGYLVAGLRTNCCKTTKLYYI